MYIDNDRLELLVKKYQEQRSGSVGNAHGSASAHADTDNELGSMLLLLATNIVMSAKYTLVDVDDAIQDGVMSCIRVIERFNPEFDCGDGKRTKAFNYFTSCILNNLRQKYRSELHTADGLRKYYNMLVDSKSIAET
jgi:hypothetical protein